MKRKALWSSLIKKYGKKELKINVRITALMWIAWAASMALLFVATASLRMGLIIATVVWSGAGFGISFLIGSIYYGSYPIRTARFIIVYEDKIVVSTSGSMDGPGFVTISRREYWVDVIARDMEVRDPEGHKIYTLVFNRPIRGCMHVRLLPDMYISEEELMKLINVLKPRRVLLNGYIFLVFMLFSKWFVVRNFLI